ncbi:MAG: hypothetical protein KDK36_06030, partial [Leptospiraceae bacterium]|nr:hypothetical protein [Leptospiraceae bacterium]
MEKDIPKIHLALGGAAYLFLIDLLCTSSLYFLNVYLAWTIAIVGSIALLIPVAKMFDTLTVWLGIIAIAVIALSYFKSEDLKIITGDKEKVLSLKSFKSNENIRTYIFQDVKVLTNYKHLKTIVKVTRNKNGTSRTTNFHYIAPLVEKNWEEGDPIPAWVVATTSPNRKAWMRPGSNTKKKKKRDE